MKTIFNIIAKRAAKTQVYMAALLMGGVGGGLLTSCGDYLEIKPQSEIILEDFWNEKADVDNVVASCYSAMSTDAVIRRMILWGEGRSENFKVGANINEDINLENVLKENITALNAYTTWVDFYNVINRCNTVIKYAPDVAEKDASFGQGDLKATIAEVSALRDLCYFYLIRTFRDVPYSTEAYIDDDQVMDLPATDFYTLLDYLIADLESVLPNAMSVYPETQPKYQTGRITKDAIRAMLCEMYLWKKDYAACIRYADEVINSRKAYLEAKRGGRKSIFDINNNARLQDFPLENNGNSGTFGSAYRSIFVNGASDETIFELSFDDNPKSNGMPSNTAVATLYGTSTKNRLMGYMSASSALTEDMSASSGRTIFADRNKTYDARIYTSCNASTGNITKFTMSSVSIDASSSTVKAVYVNPMASDDNGSKWVIYRLPDIMLLKAEALCQSLQDGSSTEINAYNKPIISQIFTLMNVVNKRSVCQSNNELKDTLKANDYLTKAKIEEEVYRERHREFLFEGKRWYDLVRRSLREGSNNALRQAVAKREGTNAQYVDNFFASSKTWNYAIFWPYNNQELKLNKNLKANPAFGSGENESMSKN